MTRCLLIAGPTAAGKTALALAAAEALDGEIINADSMQIYAGLPLITAQPAAADFARAPHHLFGSVDPAERWSVGHWAEAALGLITGIRARGRTDCGARPSGWTRLRQRASSRPICSG